MDTSILAKPPQIHHDNESGYASSGSEAESVDMEVGSVHEFVKLPMQEFNRDADVHSARNGQVSALEAENERLRQRIEQLEAELGIRDQTIAELRASLDEEDTSAHTLEVPERSLRRSPAASPVVNHHRRTSTTSSSYSISVLSPSLGTPRSPVRMIKSGNFANPLTEPSETTSHQRTPSYGIPTLALSHDSSVYETPKRRMGGNTTSFAGSPTASRMHIPAPEDVLSLDEIAARPPSRGGMSRGNSMNSTSATIAMSRSASNSSADKFEFEKRPGPSSSSSSQTPPILPPASPLSPSSRPPTSALPSPIRKMPSKPTTGLGVSQRAASPSPRVVPQVVAKNIQKPPPVVLSPAPGSEGEELQPQADFSVDRRKLKTVLRSEESLGLSGSSRSSRSSHSSEPLSKPALYPNSRSMSTLHLGEREQLQRTGALARDMSLSSVSTNASQYDYLRNSMDTTVITVFSVIDADVISRRKSKQDSLIKFTVNSTEGGGEGLTPLYTVCKRYQEFRNMDAEIRSAALVNLPKLPDTAYFTRLEPAIWDEKKMLIRMYIAELCRVMAETKHTAPIWNVFGGFFDAQGQDMCDKFKRDGLFFACGSRTVKKTTTFRLVVLHYDGIESTLTVDESRYSMNPESRRPEVFGLGELSIARDGQMLLLSKRRKRTFKTNRHWYLMCESQADAETWYNLLASGAETADFTETSTVNSYDVSTPTAETPTMSMFSDVQQQAAMMASPSPSSRWFGGLRHHRDPHMLSKTTSVSSDAGTTPTTISSAAFASPHRKSQRSSVGDNVFEFKAMGYDDIGGNGGQSSTTSSSASPNLLKATTSNNNQSQKDSLALSMGNASLASVGSVSGGYFGLTLQESFELCPKFAMAGHPVPSIIFRCVTYLLDKNAMLSEGIFRLNGMMAEINQIQRVFDGQSDCDFAQLPVEPDVNSVATLLKRYLRKLRVNIIPEEQAQRMMHLALNGSHEANAPEFRRTLQTLPQLNQGVLYVLFNFFAQVLKYKDMNKMGVSALSVLMAPNLTPISAKELCAEMLVNYRYYFENGVVVKDGMRPA